MLKKPKVEKAKNFYLDNVQKEVKRLEDRAMTLKNKAIVRTNTSVEKIRLEVDIIKISTQNSQRMMIEALCPVMNETHNLVRETRWKMDVYAKATRSDLPTNGIGARKPQARVARMGSYTIMGRGGKFSGRNFGKFREDLISPMVELIRQMNSVTPEPSELVDWPLTVFISIFTKELSETLQYPEFTLAMVGGDGDEITIRLHYYPQCKVPMHYDLFAITDITIDCSRENTGRRRPL